MSSDVISAIVGAILGGIIGIVGTVVGAIFTTNRQRRIEAGDRLRIAFHDELAALRTESGDAHEILSSSFKKHLIAVTDFKYAISSKLRISFDKAWRDYYCDDGDTSQPFLEQYSEHIGSIEGARESRSLAIKRIEHILSFSNA
jgi:hypothetical protein